MTSEDATAWSLARMNTAFWYHYDRLEYDAVLEFFAPDALYDLHGRKLRGRAEIRDVLDARPGPEMTARHILTAQHFHTISDTTAQGSLTLLGFGGPTPAEPGHTSYTPTTGGHIFELTDRYALADGHWTITHRTARKILAPALD
ncbi:nuclear transport factor 2 family protein [Streptomyces caniscabiei]|uniref:Nuclear transport factor 2 family protein n=1 Tax=Streptomyces caniscabiei TaxID=2746961 RepID=A0A927L753_9ACTN|nr:nuclear transport factor 2 family protein [Streptomyces caniscabiei]MBD9727336.1 nuclear transport factor 2 family protein [Streptomyces caniscabiei]MDX3512785.1 nuclear transport factor 2 family protein [Streptomyces caniscabiei]MDX3722310.1 nuclear transport factor 2 family protein [Streptomyces caniscabiei]WEO28713.1 nuclear transport factor 2 family protein [Streptomyces caniscabiei]